MKKKLGLLVLASATLLVPSCGRKLLRKTAAQLVATYTKFGVDAPNIENTRKMVKQVNMSWNYSTSEEEQPFAKQMIYFLTGEDTSEKNKSITLDPSKYEHFFEIGEESGHNPNYKEYVTDLIQWNLFSVDTTFPGPSGTEITFPVFDTYFPESTPCSFEAKVNDLYASKSIKIAESGFEANGSGSYHYDSYGRLLNGSVNLNIDEIHLSFNVSASYNPIKD